MQFPFGFGLSYTDFDLNVQQAEIQGTGKDAKMILKVSVTNVGTQYFGKEVVQVYYEAPQGKLGKPVRELGCFAKTELLAPGQEQILQLELPVNSMASYDDSGVTGHKSCYVLEAGCYKFYVGTDVRNAQKINLEKTEDFELPECVVTEELQEALAPTECFERIRPGEKGEHGVYTLMQEEVPLQTISLEKRIQENLPKTMEITGNKGISFQDVKNKKAELEQFVAQFTKEELSIIVRGEGMCSPLVTPGTASAFGGTAPSLSGYGIPVACTADGPSGIRMDSGLKATQMPIGTMLAASWNVSMVEELYEWEGTS